MDKNELENILRTMDIPKMRLDVNKPENLRWLVRNIRVRNSEHPEVDKAHELIRAIMFKR